jgi:integrase/recombinase XerD
LKENLNYPQKESFLFEAADKSNLSISCAQQLLKRLADRANLDGVKCSPHVFRHTFATMAIASGMNVFALKEILGHASLTTTLKYVHLKQADLKAQHDKYSPLVELMKK